MPLISGSEWEFRHQNGQPEHLASAEEETPIKFHASA